MTVDHPGFVTIQVGSRVIVVSLCPDDRPRGLQDIRSVVREALLARAGAS